MRLVAGSERIIADEATNPRDGTVRWAPGKSLWLMAMSAVAATAGPLLFSWGAFALLIVTSGITLCFGHSVGMHRRLIHESSIARFGSNTSAFISARWLGWPAHTA